LLRFACTRAASTSARNDSYDSVDQTYVNYLKERYFTENYNSFVDELLAAEDKYGCLVGDISSKNKRRGNDNCR
jgi:hypothetical protein